VYGVDFIQSNVILCRPESMTEEECNDLPAWQGDNMIVTCWRPTLREWLSLIFFRRIWVIVRGNFHPPIALRGRRTTFGKKASDER